MPGRTTGGTADAAQHGIRQASPDHDLDLDDVAITVTGAGGFIGRHVARLAAAGAPRRLRLLAHRAPVTAHPTATAASGDHAVVRGDLTDPGSLRGLCDGTDVLIHCASLVGGTAEECEAVNAEGTRALLAEAARADVARVVYLSTASVHGRGPFRAARPGDLPYAPQSPTSRSRAEAERAVLDAGGFVLRPHLVLGTGDRWVVPGLATLSRALGATVDGWQARLSLVEAGDLARALLAVATAPAERLTSRVYYANHPEPVTVDALLREVVAVAGQEWPTTDLPYARALERLRARGGGAHHLDMVAVDHWFDSEPLWRDTGCAPGPAFPQVLAPHARWYAEALRRA
ncbi:NAD-dependent epimerase/dehydratase family protein [Streptomyces sp. PTM05]|uniref:NAD-dependent epimerase/dehydratase family protein n=1 Tax=Streptantibioticus parmotrematis TaxID=2873249 RepID=A0ABS7QP19_9ACTN|nr:NAD-dependent epimerase/dehydratase family protein [Streptantibioticus parmotrematis]MBY8884673.1 NAD-dependent epimerase/dehydratase family protein [Streptantibioticus parmotrematis]